MYGKRLLVPAVVGLLVIILVFSGVSAMQRNAWTQGYMMGRLSTSADGSAVAPLIPYGYPSGPSFGLVLGVGLLIVLFLGAARAFHGRMWAMHGGPQGADAESWKKMAQAHAERHARHWRHGPPWCWDWGDESAPEASKTEAGPKSGESAQ